MAAFDRFLISVRPVADEGAVEALVPFLAENLYPKALKKPMAQAIVFA